LDSKVELPTQAYIKPDAQDAAHEAVAPSILQRGGLSILSLISFGLNTATRSQPSVTSTLARFRAPIWASKTTIARVLFLVVGLFTLLPIISAGIALMMGMFFALTIGNPYLATTHRYTPILLQVSVVGLGAAMNLMTIAAVGMHGALYTAVGISMTLALGLALGKLTRTNYTTSLLLSVGTAICGGSAIAAVASTMRAKDHEVSLSLTIVFFLNALALFLFPWIGHWAGFDENQFGLWSALAIHDTSSVVGAASQYGTKALEVATTVKLARALWIVPVVCVVSLFWMRKDGACAQAKVKRPWFILGFLLMAALVTWAPALIPAGHVVSDISQRTLVLALFLIGSGMARSTLKNIRFRPFVHGLVLWVIVGSASFLAISTGWLKL
jgi:uncharacterized integral membrane protein (TIGR00698 family)